MFIKSKKKEKNILEKEAERMFLLCKNGMEKNTILDILANFCGFNHYANLRDRINNKGINQFMIMSLWELEECQKNIIKKLKESSEYNINEVCFIQEEINKRKINILNQAPFNLFEILSIMHLMNNSQYLINKDWSLNEESVKSFLYWYSDSLSQKPSFFNKETIFERYKTYLNQNHSNKLYYSYKSTFDNFTERGFSFATHIENRKHWNNAEGFLFDLVFKLKNKEKTIDEIYVKIQEMIEYERNFHENNKSEYLKENLEVNSPYLLPKVIHEDNTKRKYGKVILGHKKEFDYMQTFPEKMKKKVRTDLKAKDKKIFKEIDIDENILLVGGCGSGVTVSGFNQVLSDIVSNKCVFYFDNRNDPSIIEHINNIADMANKKEKVLYLKIENAGKHLTSEVLNDLFEQKKVVVIQLPDCCRADESITKKINNVYKNIFNEMKKYNNEETFDNKIAVYINELEYATEETLICIKDVLESVEKNRIHFRLSSGHLSWRKREDVLAYLLENHIHHCKIMNSEDPSAILEHFRINKENGSFNLDSRELKSLLPGDFLYSYKNNIENVIYQSIYIEGAQIKSLYINPVIYNDFK